MEDIQNPGFSSLVAAFWARNGTPQPEGAQAGFQDLLARAGQETPAQLSGGGSMLAGISQFGLMGWLEADRQAKAFERATGEVMTAWDLEDDDLETLTDAERLAFEAEVEDRKQALLASAVGADALGELQERESVLYRNRPPQLD